METSTISRKKKLGKVVIGAGAAIMAVGLATSTTTEAQTSGGRYIMQQPCTALIDNTVVIVGTGNSCEAGGTDCIANYCP